MVANNQTRIAGVNPLAIEQAAKLDEALFGSLDTVVTADIIKKISTVVILNHMRRVFTKEEMNAWPTLGSGRTEDGEIDYTCNNPDWTKTMNGKRTVWVSFFDTQVIRSAHAMAVQARIDNLKDRKTASKKPAEIMDLDDEIKTEENTISVYKATWKKAVKLEQACIRQAEFYPELKLHFRKDGDGNIKGSTTPIQLWPQELPLLGENFTVSEFQSLRFEDEAVQAATDPEQKWKLLLATAARGTPEEDEDDEDNIEINNAKRFETGVASMLHFIENNNNANMISMYGKIERAQDITPYADMIVSLTELAIEFQSIAEKMRSPRKGGKGSWFEQANAILNAQGADGMDDEDAA